MLSYMLPVEEKPPPVTKNHLQLELEIQNTLQQPTSPRNGAVNGLALNDKNLNGCTMAPTSIQHLINIEQTQSAFANGGSGGGGGGAKKIIKTHVKMNPGPTISTESSASSLSSKASDVTSSASQGGATPTNADKLKPKLIQNGSTKATSLKRVSFGSSKGSMVETLIYESPLQEEPEVATPTAESPCPFSTDGDNSGSDSKNPSTKVRVTFFESSRPLVVNSPEPGDVIIDILDAANMTCVSPSVNHPQYHRQASTDSGWDNPFRPDGDLSREADEIVERIKEGKPITPTPGNGTLKTDETDGLTSKSASQQNASPQKGSNGTANCDKAGVVDVQRTVVSASNGGEVEPVVIKKKPKCKCCVIQ